MNTFNGDNEEEQQLVESRGIPYLSEDIIARIIFKFPYLSEDIVAKIIGKVPSAESVFVSFRCVCKSWFNIITSDIPSLMHPINSEPPGLIIQSMDNSSRKYLRSLSEEEFELSPEPVTYTTRFFKLGGERNKLEEQVVDLSSCFKYMKIIDSFHGLIVATNSYNASTYVVNPVTKQRLKLPPCFSEHYTKFMFVPSTGEYKVLQLIRRELDKRIYVRIVRLFSGGTGGLGVDDEDLKWKLVKVPKYVRIAGEGIHKLRFEYVKPLVINGILYLTPREKGVKKYIACFDACEDKFYKIAHPDYSPWIDGRMVRIWYLQFGGSLGYMRFDTSLRPDQDRLDIYILKDVAADPANHRKGVKEWMKQHSISLAPSILRHDCRDNNITDYPVCALRDGEVIIFTGYDDEEQRYRAYDVKLNRWWNLGVDLEPGTQNFADLYVQRTQPVLTSLL